MGTVRLLPCRKLDPFTRHPQYPVPDSEWLNDVVSANFVHDFYIDVIDV